MAVIRRQITTEICTIVSRMAHEEGANLRNIAALVRISYSSVIRILRLEKNSITFKSSSQKKSEAWKRKNELFGSVDQQVLCALTVDSALQLNELKQLIQINLNINISESKISRIIRKIGFTRKRLVKVPIERNTLERLEARANYAASLIRIPNDHLIFLDETGFNHQTVRSYGYSEVNKPAITEVTANKGTNRSLLCAIRHDGVIGYEI